jgi:hypothetical protein
MVVVRASVPATVAVALAIGATVSGCDVVCRTVNISGVCPSRPTPVVPPPPDHDQRVAVPAYGIAPPPMETVADAGRVAATPAPLEHRPPNRYGLPRPRGPR